MCKIIRWRGTVSGELVLYCHCIIVVMPSYFPLPHSVMICSHHHRWHNTISLPGKTVVQWGKFSCWFSWNKSLIILMPSLLNAEHVAPFTVTRSVDMFWLWQLLQNWRWILLASVILCCRRRWGGLYRHGGDSQWNRREEHTRDTQTAANQEVVSNKILQ